MVLELLTVSAKPESCPIGVDRYNCAEMAERLDSQSVK